MQHRHFLSLLVIMLIPTWTEVTAIEGNTTPLQRQQQGCQRLLSNDDISTKNTTSLETVDNGNEERGFTIPSLSTFKELTGKSSSFMKRAISLRKGASVVTTMEKNPVVKNVAIALEKNPSSLKTMIKDPAVVRAAGTLDKKFGSFTKTDITTLRRTFAKNPVKASKFDIGIKIIEATAAGVLTVGLVTLLILGLINLVLK
ncbi:Putative RxLR effector [Phytophthora palmivora]|uniref:RxLR effector n=1 Tax=Phytophthora palmivora TaxID=4796 RepID=A0A2P4XWE2_9STRA|nr:Putative RxLR effector [Phytophthora palmivora]